MLINVTILIQIIENAYIDDEWFYLELKHRFRLINDPRAEKKFECESAAADVPLLYFIMACHRKRKEGESGFRDIEWQFDLDARLLWESELIDINKLTIRPERLKQFWGPNDFARVVAILPKIQRSESEANIPRTLRSITEAGLFKMCSEQFDIVYRRLNSMLYSDNYEKDVE
jgi:hypothetical protein